MEIRYWNTEQKSTDMLLRIMDKNTECLFSNSKGIIPNLNTVEIETLNRCNNDCSFCPVSKGNDIREFHKMSEKLFYKIIDELSEMEYSGYLSLFSNNEPLIDNRIIDFLDYANEKCPNAIHAMFTNGLLLDLELFDQLTKHLDILFIDNYSENLQLMENVKEIVEKRSVIEDECEVIVLVRKKDQVLLNRGGLAPNKKTDSKYSSPCVLPYIQMVIRPDGLVSRCCQDAYGNTTLGDLNTQTIFSVFNGDEYRKLRTDLINGNRSNIPFCNVCDEFGLINYYPKEWNGSFLDSLTSIIEKNAKNREIEYLNFYDNRVLKLLQRRLAGKHNQLEAKKKYYIVLDYDSDIIENLEKQGLNLEVDYIICESKWFDSALPRRKDNFQYARKRMKFALKEGGVVVFGTGGSARRIISEYDLKIEFFLDNYKREDVFMGKKVFRIEHANLDKSKWYVLAMKDFEEPYHQLLSQGISEQRIIIGEYLYLD